MINLFTSYFKSLRESEYKTCLEKNLDNPYIDKVIVFEEDESDIHNDKLVKVRNGRPTYQDYFNLMSSYPNDINIISNADIFFDDSILLIKGIKPSECYAITRHEWRNGRALDFQAAHGRGVPPDWSQDVWAFQGIPRIKNCDTVLAENLSNHAYDEIKFYLGVAGCDNVIARKIQQAGYQLKNPYQQIRCIHLHQNEIRPVYTHRMTGNRTQWNGLLRVPPTQIA